MSIITFKVSIASLVGALAIGQALLMAQLYEKGRLFPFRASSLLVWHRAQGYLTFLLLLVVATECLRHTWVDWQNPRVVAHVLFAWTAIILFVAKIACVRWLALRRHAGWFGLALFVAVLGTVGTTVIWYALA